MLRALILVFLISVEVVSGIKINEIMYNPEGGDDNKEYIEIYFDEYVNLSNYTIEDLSDSDRLEEVKFVNSSFALIVGNNFDYGNIESSVYVCENVRIGNGLNNDGDILLLKDENDKIIDTVSYSALWGGDGNNNSICKLPDGNGLWRECISSAGKSNNIDVEYSLEISEFLADPQGEDDANIPEGEWVEIYNYGNEDVELKGLILNDDYGNGLIISDTNVLNSSVIKAKKFKVVYRNGDGKLELNNKGFERVKLLKGSIIIDEVIYSDSREGISWGRYNNTWQLSMPSPDEENKGNESIKESDVKIENVYDLGRDKKAEWGDLLRVGLKIFKSDINKESVKVWVEKDNERVSKISKVDVYDKFMEHGVTVPIQLEYNCDSKFKDGKYYVVVDGLDDKDKEEIEISGNSSLCKENFVIEEKKEESEFVYSKVEKSLEKANESSEKVIYRRDEEIIYKSNQNKIKRSAVFFMLGVLILLLFYFIYHGEEDGDKN